ncbi:MAG: thiamine-phosphate kinase [Alphaproteobacteria bacterium]
MDEFALIAELFAPLARDAPGAFELTDDAAVIEVTADRRLVVTKDMMVAGVHFLVDDPPALVARKLLRINLSDLAAMGARQRAYLLGLAVAPSTDEAWLRAFAAGLGEDQVLYDVHLIGGDTVATGGPFTASLTAIGEVAAGAVVRRTGARAGDRVVVSGTLGDAALGLEALRGTLKGVDEAGREALVERFRLPQPRVALGARLSGLAHAAIDVSDGLVADLGHVCAASGVGAEIEAARLPLSPAAQAALAAEPALRTAVLTGGDDYEIVFTAAADAAVEALSADLGLALTVIGRIVEGKGVAVIDEEGEHLDLPTAGYTHL